jgi:uncharacterized protein (TIGR03118 family)
LEVGNQEAIDMNKSTMFKSLIMSTIAMGALCSGARLTEAATYIQTNLVSDISGLAAITDPNLKNPWGVSFMSGSPFWISDQGKNVSTLYAVTGSTSVTLNPLVVSIPTTTSGPQGPTGQVANSNASAFTLTDGSHAMFIFGNLNGTISAWNPGNGTAATTESTTPGASFTGLAINQANTMLYAANGATGAIDVFNSSFTQGNLPGAFATPAAISAKGLVPFNVRDIGGSVYVTYAPAGHMAQAGATPGEGAVAVFNESGVLQKPPLIGGNLASPWGVTLAPASFGAFGGDLLVGNFSFLNSEINAFNPTTGAFEGMIPINDGPLNAPGGLWSLTFGGGGKDGSPNTLFFTDGINNENAGLFGAITSVPEPSTWVMMLMGFGGLGFAAYRKKKGARTALIG